MNKVIGIIGGMGPEASFYIYNSLIEQAIKFYGAKNNQDFPEIILYSIPVPDFISNDKDKKKALKMLIQIVKKMNKLDLGTLSIACNTAHLLLPQLKKFSMTAFTSMVEEVVRRIAKDKLNTIGLLASPTTIRSKLYQTKLEEKNISVVLPSNDEIESLNKIIRNIIKGEANKKDSEELIIIANQLIQKGAEGIILGCTELPLIFSTNQQVPIYNSTEILANELLKKYYKGQ